MPNKTRLAWETIGDRSGHEAGRALLARLYREATGQELPQISVTERGKPYFPGGKWYFSISHTPRNVFCALSECPVGIDAEQTDRKVRLELAEKVLSQSEYARWLRCEDKNGALLRLWVLKEAAAKLSGEGLRGYPDKTDFAPDDPRVRELGGCYVAVLTQEDENAV